MQEKNYDFFLSYNKNDIGAAKRLASVIKNSGLTCWWQYENSKQEYAVEIREAIKRCSAFIVLLSPHSAASEWVGREILEAIRLYSSGKIKILPILVSELEKSDYDYFYQILGNFNWLFLQDYERDKELIASIASQVGVDFEEKSSNSIYSAEAEIEQERLRKQNNLYNLYASPVLDELFREHPCPSVLDIGSSNCDNIMLRLDGREFSHLLCVDKDGKQLREGKARYRDGRISFLESDITSAEFVSQVRSYLKAQGLAGFDLIHVCAVLLHLENSQALLATLREFLNEGGSIFVQDEDDGYNVAFEENSDEPGFFRDCFYIWKHSKESGDRYMARKLALYLKKAGFRDVELRSTVISSVDFDGKFKEDLWDFYLNPTYWVVDSEDYFDKKDAFEKCGEYTRKHRKQKMKYMNDEIFLTLGVLIYTARR